MRCLLMILMFSIKNSQKLTACVCVCVLVCVKRTMWMKWMKSKIHLFRLVVVMSWCEWHFRNDSLKHFFANFQIDLSADGFVIVGHIAHGNISTQTWTGTTASYFSDMLITAKNVYAMPCGWALFQPNSNASTTATIFQLIYNVRCAGEIGFGSTTFCCKYLHLNVSKCLFFFVKRKCGLEIGKKEIVHFQS